MWLCADQTLGQFRDPGHVGMSASLVANRAIETSFVCIRSRWILAFATLGTEASCAKPQASTRATCVATSSDGHLSSDSVVTRHVPSSAMHIK